MTRTISLATLKREGACQGYVDLFSTLFGDRRVPVNDETAHALRAAFPWNWAAQNLLTPKQRRRYRAVLAKGEAAYRPKRADEHNTATAAAFAAAYNSPRK